MDTLKGISGKTSMMRMASISVVAIVMAVFLAHNIVSMVKGGGMVNIGAQEVALITAALAAKAAQRFGEHNEKKSDIPAS